MTSGGFVIACAMLALCLLVFIVAGEDREERLYTGAMRTKVRRRWGDRCAYRFPVVPHICRGGIQIDHQKPYSVGGRTTVRNGQPLCAKANRRKGARTNTRYVLTHSIPVVGWIVYLVRWIRAEVLR